MPVTVSDAFHVCMQDGRTDGPTDRPMGWATSLFQHPLTLYCFIATRLITMSPFISPLWLSLELNPLMHKVAKMVT